MAHHGHSSQDCGCHVTSSSVHQTLDEMEFERGLWSFALSGQLEDVEKRLQKGDDVNARDKSGYTALHYAARNGHLQVCRSLLKYGAQVNAATNTGQVTPLHRAAYMGHRDLIQLLLQHGADPLLKDADGMTALHKAADGGHADTAEVLLKTSARCAEMKDVRDRLPVDLARNADLKTLLAS